MLSVASLLNPAPTEGRMHRFPPTPASLSPSPSFADDSAFYGRPMMPMLPAVPQPPRLPANQLPSFQTAKVKGLVNFPPFDRLDEMSAREVRKYRVTSLDKIQDHCKHIPYNSGKKDFFEKTGRESFEVFQYAFKLPGEDAEYMVMWDYNVGLVRMTPFFKCCKYSKTTPAKMLNQNPGLKEITHSITGGSIVAQGYWMPYDCAKAVCATFCYYIAGALVPIFGPDFPQTCIPPESPNYGRMVIDPAIIIQSTREAEHFRGMHINAVTTMARDASPRRDGRSYSPYISYEDTRHRPRHRVRRRFVPYSSPYATDTDGDASPDRRTPGRYLYSPVPAVSPLPPISSLRPGSGWTPANIRSPRPDALAVASSLQHGNGWTPENTLSPRAEALAPGPWLSAVPRINGGQAQREQTLPPPPQVCRNKRSADHLDADDGYEAGESRLATRANTAANSPTLAKAGDPPLGGPDNNAALLLLSLRVRDSVAKGQSAEVAVASETDPAARPADPRKRIRTKSM